MPERVAIGGLLHESNTFLSVPTELRHFEQGSLTRGDELIQRWEGTHHELGGFLEGARKWGFTALPLLAAYAVPSGTITQEAFEQLCGELLARLRAARPVDGLLLALHGATVAANAPDADGEILRRCRQELGPEVPIVATVDLHANISQRMVENSSVLVAYRSNPHLDQKQRGVEAAEMLARTMRGEIRPVQALECPPLLIDITKQYSQEQPAAGLYEDLSQVLSRPGILSASIAMGFPYADVEEMGASFVAVSDGDPSLARSAAQWMAARAWSRRWEFVGEALDVKEAVAAAAAAREGPVALMDVGDNVGGGSPGDSTILFAEVLRKGVRDALVVLCDPGAVSQCVSPGVRSEIELYVGAKTDGLHGTPVPIKGRVRCLSDGIFVETEVRHGAQPINDQGITAVVETQEGHTVVLTTFRMAPMSLEQVRSLGIKPERKKILIVKGVVAPRAAYQEVAKQVWLVDTPGITSSNPRRFTYHHRRRPIFPLEADAVYAV